MNMKKYKSHYQEQVFSLFKDPAVLFHPELIKITGSLNAAIFISQLLYWYDKGSDHRWIYKTAYEIEKETGLTRHKQDEAIKRCLELGIIDYKLAKIPAKRHFFIYIAKLQELIISLSDTSKLDKEKVTNTRVKIMQSTTENTKKTTSNQEPGEGYKRFKEAGEALKRKRGR